MAVTALSGLSLFFSFVADAVAAILVTHLVMDADAIIPVVNFQQTSSIDGVVTATPFSF